jgi:hypothetical protein
MALVLDVVTHKNVDGSSKDIVVVRDNVANKNYPIGMFVDSAGNPVDASHPLSVKIEADAAGSSVVTDDGSVPRNNSAAALAAAVLYGANGVGLETVDRIIAHIFSGALKVSEGAAQGTSVTTQKTVDATTANGVQLVAANTTGTRRRIIITQRGTTLVEVVQGNITAATGKGRPLVGVAGVEQSWFIAGELRATCVSGTQDVSVTEEVFA